MFSDQMQQYHPVALENGELQDIDVSKVEVINLSPRESPMEVTPVVEKELALKPLQPPAAETKPRAKIEFLNGLRGFAAIFVVVQHTGYLTGSSLTTGQPAVDTFFVLSAFLLTMGLEKKFETLLQQKASLKRWGWALLDYFMRRFLRVYPLFLLVAIYLGTLSPDDKKLYFFIQDNEPYNLLNVLTFEFNSRFFVFWTLPLEITYYFMIPPFVLATLLCKKWWWVLLTPLSIWAVYSGCTEYRGYRQGLKPHLATFVCGSIAAFVYTRAERTLRPLRENGSKLQSQILTAGIRTVQYLTLALFFSVVNNAALFHWVAKNPVPQTAGTANVAQLVAIVIVCELLAPKSAIASFLEWSFLLHAGKVSFSLYLLHTFIVHRMSILNQAAYDRFFLVWGLSFLVATISYHIVEKPSQKLAHFLGQAIKRRDALEIERAKARTLADDQASAA